MNNKIISIETVFDAKILFELNADKLSHPDDQERLIKDLINRFFYGYFVIDSNIERELRREDIKSYVLFYNSYSSWQNRTIHLFDLWFKSSLSDDEKYSILKEFRSKLFSYAKENFLNRVNYHILESKETKQLTDWLQNEHFGALNLSHLEEWLIYEMDLNGMRNFVSLDFPIPKNYKILKVVDINEYCLNIRDLIHEISIFEKMEDQFKLSVDRLKEDYNYLDDKRMNRFYEAMVVLDDKEQVIGYSIYFKIYEVKRGVGCYLEDLYIQERFRRSGLGRALWKELIKDCLENFSVNFMQWSVLAWNTPAIEFYHKCGARRLEDLSLFRFTTENIYQ